MVAEDSQYELLIIDLEQKLLDFGDQTGLKLKRAGVTRLAGIMADILVDKILDSVEGYRTDLQDTVKALMEDLDRKDLELCEMQQIQFSLEETINYLECR